MKIQDIPTITTEQVDIVKTVVEQRDVVKSITVEQKRVLGPNDKYEEFDDPQMLGVYTSNAVQAADRQNLTPIFEGFIGREVDFVMDFHNGDLGWTSSIVADWVLARWEKVLAARAKRPNFMFTLQNMFPSKNDSGVVTTYTFADVANGVGDSTYKLLAEKLVQRGFGNALIRIGHEMDGTFRGRYCARGVEATWAAAFRRIVDVMRPIAPNLKFGICPTNEWVTQLGASWLGGPVYPGDAHVDWIGLDIYDMHWSLYPTITAGMTDEQKMPIWQRAWNDNWFLKQLNTTRDLAKAHGKPMSLCEWGNMYFMHSGQQRCGVDNPYWMEQMCKWILDPANDVAHHSYFNASRGDYRPGTTVDGAFSCRLGPQYQPPSTTLPGDAYPTLFPKAGEVYKKYFGGKKKRYFRASGLVE